MTARPGEVGNTVIAGHSSYFKSAYGRYKTVFSNLAELDTGEEVWVYWKSPETGAITLYRYTVRSSYNTEPSNTQILLPGTGNSRITLFTCTPIGGIAGRWIVEAELIHQDGESCSVRDAGGNTST